MLFPIGHLTKAEVKAIAAQRLAGTKILSKAESMGICFIGKRDMRDFLEDYITLTSGRYTQYIFITNYPVFEHTCATDIVSYRYCGEVYWGTMTFLVCGVARIE